MKFNERINNAIKCLKREEKLGRHLLKSMLEKDEVTILMMQDEYRALNERAEEETLGILSLLKDNKLSLEDLEEININEGDVRFLPIILTILRNRLVNSISKINGNENSIVHVATDYSVQEEYFMNLLKVAITTCENSDDEEHKKRVLNELVSDYMLYDSIRYTLAGEYEKAERVSDTELELGPMANPITQELSTQKTIKLIATMIENEQLRDMVTKIEPEIAFLKKIHSFIYRRESSRNSHLLEEDIKKMESSIAKAKETSASETIKLEIELAALYMQLKQHDLVVVPPEGMEITDYGRERIQQASKIAELYNQGLSSEPSKKKVIHL